MNNKLIIFTLLGVASVYGQTPCSHTFHSEPSLSEASSVVSKYEPVPAAQELLNKDYLPPQAPFEYSFPQANQPVPVYVAPPQPALPKIQTLPKLQPLPSTYRPVYQPLPSTVKPVVFQPFPKLQPLSNYQHLPSTVKPVVIQPLAKLQPLPNYQPLPSTVKPVVIQPLPKLQPLPNYSPIVQPLPNLQPFPRTVQPFSSTFKPFISRTIAPSTLRPLPTQPKLSIQPLPAIPRLQPLKPVQPIPLKQFVPPKSNQFRDNEIPQATSVQAKLAKPDLEPAAQTIGGTLRLASPDRAALDRIKINHYICEQGNEQQKFFCDILKLWDLNHGPSEITSNDLDNPGDNSNNNPAYATLPTTRKPIPVPTYAPTTTTTTTTKAPELERDVEELPGDSQQNLNAIEYLPPYMTTTTTTTTTTTPAPTTEIPKRPDASDENASILKPGYEYPKPSVPFPVPEKEGYDYPKPVLPFSDGASFSSLSSVPLTPYNSASSNFGSSLTSNGRFSDSLSSFRTGLASFSDSVQYKPLASPAVTSTTIAPDLFFKSNSEFLSSPPFSYNFQPISTASFSGQKLSPISQYTLSTPVPPAVSYTSAPAFSQSFLTSTTTASPLTKSKETAEKSFVTSTTAAPLPTSYSFQPTGQYYSSLSPISYSVPSYEGSLSSFSPLNYNFDNSLNSFNSFNYQPLSSAYISNISPLTSSTLSPLENSIDTSTAKSSLSSSAASFSSSLDGSQKFSQYSNSPAPAFNYYFKPIETVSTAAPLAYNYDLALGAKSNLTSASYQSLSGQSLSAQSPISYSFQPLSQSFASGQSYSFPSTFSSGSSLAQSQFVSSPSPAISYTSSSPFPFNFQSYSTTASPQPYSAFSSSQSGHSSSSSGLSFGSQAQSVANLKDLQATAKELSLDLRLGGSPDNSLFGKEDDDARRKSTSSDEKEDISLGNIEILKVKRKSPSHKQ